MAYKGVVFDLLTALLDSWSLWDKVAGEDGFRWRKEYLKLTYGAGHYSEYENVVRESALNADLPPEFANMLKTKWSELKAWEETNEVLGKLSLKVPMAIATNCSEIMGKEAADILEVKIPIVITAESAGFYKPHKRPYEMAIEKLGLAPSEILFVAGSASDVPGASSAGLDVYWHNKKGLAPIEGNSNLIKTSSSLKPLLNYF